VAILAFRRDPMKTVWIYVDTSKGSRRRRPPQFFANEQAAEKWFAENDPEGVAFEYPIEGSIDGGPALR
jgi:hypothetical protein